MSRTTSLRHVRGEGGFTLIELMIVMTILGILSSIAVPNFLTFRARAQVAAAEANVSSAIPAAETVFENAGSYAGLSIASLQAEAPGVSLGHVVVSADGRAYCIDAASGPKAAYYIGGDQNVGGDHKGFHADSGANYMVAPGSPCSSVVSG